MKWSYISEETLKPLEEAVAERLFYSKEKPKSAVKLRKPVEVYQLGKKISLPPGYHYVRRDLAVLLIRLHVASPVLPYLPAPISKPSAH